MLVVRPRIIHLNRDKWDTTSSTPHLSIIINPTENSDDILSVYYKYRTPNNSIYCGTIENEIFLPIAKRLVNCNSNTEDSDSEMSDSMSYKLTNFIVNIEPHKIRDIALFGSTMSTSESDRGISMYQLAFDTFVMQLAFYFVVCNLVSQGLIRSVSSLNVDLPYRTFDERYMSSNCIYYMMLVMDNAHMVNPGFDTQVSRVFSNFYYTWKSVFVRGDNLNTSNLVYKMVTNLNTRLAIHDNSMAANREILLKIASGVKFISDRLLVHENEVKMLRDENKLLSDKIQGIEDLMSGLKILSDTINITRG